MCTFFVAIFYNTRAVLLFLDYCATINFSARVFYTEFNCSIKIESNKDRDIYNRAGKHAQL